MVINESTMKLAAQQSGNIDSPPGDIHDLMIITILKIAKFTLVDLDVWGFHVRNNKFRYHQY